MKNMTQLAKVATYLRKNTRSPGVTSERIAKQTGVPKASVGKRIYDLREDGYVIYTNTRKINGRTKSFYRFG